MSNDREPPVTPVQMDIDEAIVGRSRGARARRALIVTGAVVLGVVGVLGLAGGGFFGSLVTGGDVEPTRLDEALVDARAARQAEATEALEIESRGQILFGDLHVHSSFSMDAFQLALPIAGGEGLHPVADACDFARFCAQLDFWSINDHANSLSGRRWRETIRAVRQCDAVAAGGDEPDLVSFLGWEWTQMGSTPDNHYGHKNVLLRDLDDDSIPTRPIAAAPPPGVPSTFDTGGGGRLALGLGAFAMAGGHDLVRALAELQAMEVCPVGVPVRDLSPDCREAVATPGELFEKLDDWGYASIVIPHGTTWGMYTPGGSSWAKQLRRPTHDPDRQTLVEVYSGHGNSEEYRPWVAAEIRADGTRRCPEPTADYRPSCWRAGEIIRERCLAESEDPAECEKRAVEARQNFVDADRNAGPWTVPGIRPHDLLDAGQCRDCFQPAFNYRPLGSVQSMLALSRPAAPTSNRSDASDAADVAAASEASAPLRFRFGFIASSDNHTARAGTGYKEVERREFTDARMGEIGRSSMVTRHRRPARARSERFDASSAIPSVAFLETERGGSFYLSGGLAAVHAESRDREDIWSALERRETYGTSGPRILLWFDLLDPERPRGVWPMGSEVRRSDAPTFRVRAAGSFEPLPGCPESTRDALSPERLEALCRGECLHPSDRRRPITRIEVVRIRPQRSADEDLAERIEDPWRVLPCEGDARGCEVVFSDPEYASQRRDTVYYVRAIEAPSPVVDANPLGCRFDENGECIAVDPCFDRPDSDDCRSDSEQRAWSSPIFVDYLSDSDREESGVEDGSS